MDNDLTLFSEGPTTNAARLESATGWALKPEGLCKGDVCVLVPDRAPLHNDGVIQIADIGALLDRPVATDTVSGVTAMGAPRAARRGALDDLIAPDFTLPDLNGTWHSLSDHRSKKRLLVTLSSW
jgi:hypothetical protein